MFYLLAQDDWYNRTTLHPLGVFALLVLSIAALTAPRRYALVPMLIMACFVATAQRVVFATLDFNFLRVLILVGWVRVVLRRETGGFSLVRCCGNRSPTRDRFSGRLVKRAFSARSTKQA